MIVKDAVRELALHTSASLQRAMEILDRTARGVVLAVDDEFHLLTTITDGDIRRGLLGGLALDSPLSEIIRRKAASEFAAPTTVRLGAPREEVLRLMEERCIRHIPVVDDEGHVVDLVTADQLVPNEVIAQAVIMAGGFGKRLFPLTEHTPKPMLHVGDRPLLERTIEQLRQAGIQRVNVTTHYLPEKITEHFGDGSDFGVELKYVSEDTPLGTAGALGLMDAPTGPVLVLNGDVLTRVNYRTMLDYHREHGADLTVAVRQFGIEVPYGVVECSGGNVVSVKEKPTVNFLVNAGIYLLEPAVYAYLENGRHCDMPELIQRLLAAGRTVCSFLIHEYWLDIGKYDDYLRAQEDVRGDAFA